MDRSADFIIVIGIGLVLLTLAALVVDPVNTLEAIQRMLVK